MKSRCPKWLVMVEQVVPVAAPEHAVNKAVAHNRLENSNLQKMANENPYLSARPLNFVDFILRGYHTGYCNSQLVSTRVYEQHSPSHQKDSDG